MSRGGESRPPGFGEKLKGAVEKNVIAWIATLVMVPVVAMAGLVALTFTVAGDQLKATFVDWIGAVPASEVEALEARLAGLEATVAADSLHAQLAGWIDETERQDGPIDPPRLALTDTIDLIGGRVNEAPQLCVRETLIRVCYGFHKCSSIAPGSDVESMGREKSLALVSAPDRVIWAGARRIESEALDIVTRQPMRESPGRLVVDYESAEDRVWLSYDDRDAEGRPRTAAVDDLYELLYIVWDTDFDEASRPCAERD